LRAPYLKSLGSFSLGCPVKERSLGWKQRRSNDALGAAKVFYWIKGLKAELREVSLGLFNE
jgi:hypothetical protein